MTFSSATAMTCRGVSQIVGTSPDTLCQVALGTRRVGCQILLPSAGDAPTIWGTPVRVVGLTGGRGLSILRA